MAWNPLTAAAAPPPAKPASAFPWTTLINPAMSIGFGALADKVNPPADKLNAKESARQFDIKTGRADQVRNAMMPGLATNLGMNPARLQAMQGAGGKPMFGGGYPAAQSSGGGSGLGGKIAGIGLGAAAPVLGKMIGNKIGGGLGAALGGGAGAATGLGATLAGGAMTAGLGAAIPFAIQGISKLMNPAHEKADMLTKPGGLSAEFDRKIGEIWNAPIPEEQKANAVRYLYSELQQQAAQFAAQGGDHAKVANQMLEGIRTNHPAAKYLGGM